MTSVSSTAPCKSSILAIPLAGAGDKSIEPTTLSSLTNPKELNLDKRIEACRLALLGLDTLKITHTDEEASKRLLTLLKEALEITTIACYVRMQSLIAFEASPKDKKISKQFEEDTIRYDTIFKIAQSTIQKGFIKAEKKHIGFSFQVEESIFSECFIFALTQEQALKKKYDALLESVQKNPFLLSLQKEKKDLEMEFNKLILVLEKFINRAKLMRLDLKEFSIPLHIYQAIHKNCLEKIKKIHIELIFAKMEYDSDRTDPIKKTDFFLLKKLYADSLQEGIDFFKKTPECRTLIKSVKTGLKKEINLAYNKILYKATLSHLLETGKLRSQELSDIQKKISKNSTDPTLALEKKLLEQSIAKIIQVGCYVMDLCNKVSIDLTEFGLQSLRIDPSPISSSDLKLEEID